MRSVCQLETVLKDTMAVLFLKIQLPLLNVPGLSNAAPVIYFPGALFYSAGFNVNQNLKKNLNNSMFQFFP
jgi:hypothetical protein